MKKKQQLLFAVIALLFVIAVFYFKMPGATGTTGLVTTKLMLPAYGHAVCEGGATTDTSAADWVPAEGVIIDCPGTTCTLQVNSNYPQSFAENPDGIFYNVCSSTTCSRNGDDPNYITTSSSNPWPGEVPSNVWSSIVSFNHNEHVFLQYAELNWWSNLVGQQKFAYATANNLQWRLDYTPMVLKIVNSMNQYSQTNGCNLGSIPGFGLVTDANVLDANAQDPTKCTTNACEPGGYINWIEKWVVMDVVGGVINYNGKEMICAAGAPTSKLWELGTMTINGNEVVKYPVKASIDVPCCPGQEQGEAYCNSNFQWVPRASVGVECFSDAQCPGQNTQWLARGTDISKMDLYGCVGGACAITHTKTVQCNEMLPCTVGTCIDNVCKDITTSTSPKTVCEDNGGTWVIKYASSGRILETRCQMPTEFNWMWVLGGVLGLGVLILFFKIIERKRSG